MRIVGTTRYNWNKAVAEYVKYLLSCIVSTIAIVCKSAGFSLDLHN